MKVSPVSGGGTLAHPALRGGEGRGRLKCSHELLRPGGERRGVKGTQIALPYTLFTQHCIMFTINYICMLQEF